MPRRKIGKSADPGGVPAAVPIVDAIVKPIADPNSADTNPTLGPRNIEPTKIAAGARVIVDSGGGNGNAVTVRIAIRADITADCDMVVTRFLFEENPLLWSS